MLKKILLLLVALTLAFVAYLFWQAGRSETQTPATAVPESYLDKTVVAFGSCNREERPQGYWETIGSHRPAAWLWLGDNVYADSPDTAVIAAAYDRQKQDPNYRAFRKGVKHIYGIWDDHDYGKNDAGKEWPIRAESRNLMLRFLDVPRSNPVWTREGGYQSYTIGEGEQRIKIILLDTRYFRDAFYPGTDGQRYGANPSGDILGEEQWTWLEQELRDSEAAVHLIGSSIQVLSAQHPYEKWANFPAARERLLDLIRTSDPGLPLLLSGDRHVAELSRIELGGLELYDFTASGLTHAYESAEERNDLRVSPLIGQTNFGLLTVLWSENGPRLLAESRSVTTDEVFFAQEVRTGADAGANMNTTELVALLYPKDGMPEQLKPCPQSPNCVSTQSTQEKKLRDPIPFTGTVTEARQRLIRVVGDMSRTTLVADRGNYLHYTFKTWPIPFTDDVEFLIDEDAKLIHYRSASRVGKSDLGVNSRRMAKVVAAFLGE